jgi:hypothetical protein
MTMWRIERSRKKVSRNSTWTVGVFALSVCLFFASGLAAQDQSPAPPPPPQSQGDAYGGVAPTLTLPAGTAIVGEVSQYLSSNNNRPGDGFTITLDQPLIVNGWVVARRGQVAHGEVTVASKGGTGKGSSQLGIQLTEITLVDGQLLPINTQLIQYQGGSNAGRNASTVATTTVLGAAIGAIAGGGEGAGIGAGIGAAAGAAGVLLTPGKPTVIAPESTLTFRMTDPANFSTQGSERAFLPVSPQDYGNGATTARAPRPGPGREVRPYPPYPYPYPYPYAYAYPYPYYYGYGYRPRVRIVRPYRPPIRVFRGRR